MDDLGTTLRHAAARPVHAYLLVGARTASVDDAVRVFAAELIGLPDNDRSRDLVRRGLHPDVIEFEPTTNTYTLANEVREPRDGEIHRRDRSLPRILPELHKSPVEADRKVVVLREAHRMEEPVANALLKSIEEPPPRSVVVLMTPFADALLPTVRSRCRRIDFPWVEPEPSATARTVRDAFASVVDDLDGTGAAVARAANGIDAALADALDVLAADQERERRSLDEELERAGYPDRTAQAMRKRVEERQRQEERRARKDALLEGLGAVEARYRDALVAGTGPGGPAAIAALDACRDARDAFEFNPNESLLLERLLLQLPPLAGRGDR